MTFSPSRQRMGQAQGIMAIGLSLQLLVLTLALVSETAPFGGVLFLSGLGFFIVVIGAALAFFERRSS